MARLRAFHHTAQSQPDKKGLSQCGLDLINGKVCCVSVESGGVASMLRSGEKDCGVAWLWSVVVCVSLSHT